MLPEGLADSITAIFVPLGSSDEYRLKNNWKSFAFIEGEPQEVTLQVGAMGTLESEIQRAGLQPRDINFLTVEGKLDNNDFKLIRDYMPNLVARRYIKDQCRIHTRLHLLPKKISATDKVTSRTESNRTARIQ